MISPNCKCLLYPLRLLESDCQIRCLDCSNWIGAKEHEKEIICPFCQAEYYLSIDGVDAVFYKKRKVNKMIKVDQAKAIWDEVIIQHWLKRSRVLLKDLEYEQKIYERLIKVKISRQGKLKADHRKTAWAMKHFPSLVKIYEKRIEDLEEKSNSSKG